MAKFKLPKWLQSLVSKKSETFNKKFQRRQLAMEALEDRVTPTTLIWDGGGGSNAWSNPLNWNDNIHTPETADAPVDLVFPSGVSQLNTSNDILNLTINSISFSGSGYNVTGNGLLLGGADSGSGFIVANAGAINNTVALPITLGGVAGNRQFFTVGTAGASLSITGQLSGTTGVELSKDGPGVLVLTSDNSPFTGPISIVEGAINIRNSLALGNSAAPTTVLSTVQKSGQLQVQNVVGNIAEPLFLNGSGPLNDGALLNVLGNNTITGNIELDSDATIGSNSGSLIIKGILSDLGAGHNLSKEGGARVVLDPINPAGTPAAQTGNSYRGRTFVNNGTLTIRHSLALGNDPTPVYGINDTVVQSTPNRSGTLDLEYLANPLRIDPNENAGGGGFTVPTELLTLNGPGFEGIHILPKQPLSGQGQTPQAGFTFGQTVHGALHNEIGVNTWAQDIQLWSSDSDVVGDNVIWSLNGVLPTVGFGAEANGKLIITGHIRDDNLSGTAALSNRQYSLIKVRPGRVQFVEDNFYRGKTEILAGYLNIADSLALGAATLGNINNGTFIFPEGTLELEADDLPDSVIAGSPPHALQHLNTDLVITNENIRPMGNGANNDGAIRNLRGVNEITGNIQLQRRLPRNGVSFFGLGASFGAVPDYNMGSPTQTMFDRSQLTVSGIVGDDTLFGNVSSNLTKFGQGELVLTNSNTYTGRTFISEGWITVRDDHALGNVFNAVVEVDGLSNAVNAPPFSQLSDTKSPETYIAPGAMLVLKQTRAVVPSDINLTERIFVSGDGIDHLPETSLGYTVIGGQLPNLELNHNGAILNLSGNNTISGIVTLVATTGSSLVGIGADLDSTDPSVTQSSLAFSNIIREDIDVDNIGDLSTLPGPGRFNGSPVSFVGTYPYAVATQPAPAGINKLGRKRVELQGFGYFTGDNRVTAGVLRAQSDTALGMTTGTTTVMAGAALELAGYNTLETKLPAPIDQYANSVFAFSSQFTTTSWSADQALGGPNTTYGDIPTAWSALNTDGPPDPEFLDLRYQTPVFAAGVAVTETYNNGFVSQIDLVDVNDVYHTVFTGPDNSQPGAPVDLVVNFPTTNYLVKGVKVYVDPLHVLNDWEEIDAVKLSGFTSLTPTTTFVNTFNGGEPGGIQIRENLVLNGMGNFTADDTTNNLSSPTRVDTLTSLFDDNQVRSSISLQTDVTIDSRTNSRLTLWKPISGPGGFTKEGDGKLVIGGVNTYLGDTIIGKGTVTLESSSALGNPSVSETQSVTVTGIAGTFTLTFNGQTTASLAFNANAAAVQAALNALSSIGGVGGSVTVSLSLGVYTVTFGGSLANTNLPEMTATGAGGATATVSTQLNGGGGTTVADNAQIEMQGDITIGGEALRVQGNGPNSSPNIPLRWYAQGPAPINDTTWAGNAATGRVTGVVTDPLDPNVIYLSAAGGGAWRSKNNGVTWQPLIDNINGVTVDQALFTGAIAVAPTDSNTIYVGLGESNNSGDSFYGRGILKSSDFGKTWDYIQPPGDAFDKHSISRIVVDPLEPNTIYVAVQGNAINEGLGGSGNPSNYGIWRLRNGVWVNLISTVTTPFIYDGGNFQQFTDLQVFNANPRITVNDILHPNQPNRRIIAFALGNADGGGDFNTDNAVYTSIDADTTNSVPTWTVNSFPIGLENIGFGTIDPPNGMIKITGARNATSRDTINLFAVRTYPLEFHRLLTGTANTFRDVQTCTVTYDPNTNLWTANAWGAMGTQPPPGIQGPFVGQGSYDSVIAEQSQLVNIPWLTGTSAFTRLGNPNFVFIAGTSYGQNDGPYVWNGSAWNPQNPGAGGKGPHVDYHAWAYDATGRLVVGNDGGIWRMENVTAPGANAANWTNLNQPNTNVPSFLQITTMWGVDVHPFNPFFAIGGSQDNGTEIYNDNYVWTNTDGGDGGLVQINNVNPNFVFKTENGQLYRSTQGGAPGSWNVVYTTRSGNLYFPLVVDRVNPSRVLIGDLDANNRPAILESLSNGDPGTFQVIGAATSVPNGISRFGFVSNGVFSFGNQIGLSNRQGSWALDPDFPLVLDQGADAYDSDTVYVLTAQLFFGPPPPPPDPPGGVYVTKNHGSNWVRRNGTGANSLPSASGLYDDYSQIVVDPRNRDVAYVVRSVFNGAPGQHVFKTTDAAQNWIDISGNLPDVPCWSVAVNTRNGDIYVGTDNGVYYLAGGTGSNWQRFGVGLPNVMVSGINFNALTNMLTVSTYGRGMFQLWLDDSKPDSGAIRAVTGSSVWTGPVTLTGDVDLRAEVNSQLNFVGTITDDTAGANHLINKVGPGRVVFSGANTFGGKVDVKEGALVVRSANALGSPAAPTGITTVEIGAALELQSDLFRETVVLNGNGIKFNGHDTGALRSVSNNNTFTGTLVLNTNATVGVDSGSQLTIGTTPGDPTGATNGLGTIDDGVAQRRLVKELSGTMVLNSANTYDGLTDVIQGVLRVEHGSALGSGLAGTQVRNGAQLQLSGGITVAGETLTLSGSGIFGTGALENFAGNNTWQGNVVLTAIQGVAAPPPPLPPATINIGVLKAAETLTIDGAISQQVVTIPAQPPVIPSPVTFTSFGLTKVLPGKLILKGSTNNTYTGVTTVQTGVLNVQKAQALGTIAAGTVVNNGAALETEGNITYVAETLTLNGKGVAPANLGALRNIIGANNWTGPVILNTTVLASSGTPNPQIFIGSDAPITEVQTVTVTGTTGNFTLTFNGQTTSSLPFSATAQLVQDQLNSLSTIGGVGGSVAVTATTVPGGTAFTITFGGTLAGANQPLLVASGSGGASASVVTTTDGSVSQLTISGEVQDPTSVFLPPPQTTKPAELHKVGDGTVVFPNANSYIGLTVIDNGILNIRNDGSLGAATAGTIVNTGGTLQTQGGFTETDEPLTLFGTGENNLGALANNKDNNTWANTVVLGNNNVAIGSNADTLTITGQITDGINSFGVTKVGLATVQFAGAADNEIQGVTTVATGTLLLNKPTDTFNFDGSLAVGDGIGAVDSAILLLGTSNQIPNASATTVNADGLLDLNGFTETINTLAVNDGHVQTDAGVLTIGGSLTMTGGDIELNGAGNQLLFVPTATINGGSSAAETAVIHGAGAMALVGASPRTIDVRDGPLGVDMEVSARISRTGANERLIKDGPGTLQLSSNVNSLNGITEAHAGVLQVDGTIGAVELNGGTLGGNGFTGTVNSLPGGGIVNPGDSPGILHTGNVVWNPATTFFVELNRLNPTPSPLNAGTDYDRLAVSGNIFLGGAHLDGFVDAIGIGIVTEDPPTTVGDSFTIITTTGGTVNGQFAEGDHVFIFGKKFTIQYNPTSVVLTKVKANVTIDIASSANPSVWGQPVTFTITAIPEPGANPIPSTATIDIHLVGPNEDVTVSKTLTNGQFSFNSVALFGINLEVGVHQLGIKFHDPTKNFQDYPIVPEQFLNQIVNKADSTISLVSTSGVFTPEVQKVTVAGTSGTFTLTFKGQTTSALAFNAAAAAVKSALDALSTIGGSAGSVDVTLSGSEYTVTFRDGLAGVNVPQMTGAGAGGASVTVATLVNGAGASVYGDANVKIIAKLGIVPPGGTENGTSVMSGTVTFRRDGVVQGTTSVFFNGTQYVAEILVPADLPVSDYAYSATYSGDNHFNGVSTTSDLVQNIVKADTAVTVTGNPSPSDIGQNVTFTVTVVAINPSTGTPTGTVIIKDGSTVFGTHTVDANGQWQFQISTLAFGTHTINVDYQGDSNFNISNGTTQHIVRGDTQTTIVSSLNPSTYGQNVNFTVTVSAIAPASGFPTGTVDILDNGVVISGADDLALANGQVSFATNQLTAGTHVITAAYSGTSTLKPSTGTVTPDQVVNKASTSTTLAATPGNPTVYGQQITFTAVVSVLSPGGGTLTGTVDFLDNGVVLPGGDDVPLVGSQATLATTLLGAGVHSNITAKYNGTTNYNISTSSPLSRTVNKANTQTALTSDALPSAVYGQATIKATVTVVAPGGNIPAGDVTFFITNTLTSQTTQRTITLDATGAAVLTPPLDVGSYSIFAKYNGNANYNASANSNTINQTITQAATATLLATSDNDAVFGEPIITATVTTQSPGSGIPVGSVVFHVDNGVSNTNYTVTLDMNGVATLPTLDAGNYTITGDYLGSTNFMASVGAPTLSQTIHPANSDVDVQSSANPSRYGQSVTFTATVSAVSPGIGVPPGSVHFVIDNVDLTPGGVTLANGQATFTISTLSVATHLVVVNYGGSNNFNPSSDNLAGGQIVQKGDTTTVITSSANPSALGAAVTFTATVSAVSPAVGVPSGFMRFFIDGAQQPDVPLNGSAQAQISNVFVTQGDHAIQAFYQSDANFNTSIGTLTQNVKANSTTTVTTSVNPSIFGQTVTFTATITPPAPSPTGSVNFIIDGVTVATNVGLTGNTATYQTNTLTVSGSPHTVQAHYNGDVNWFPSDGTLSGGQSVTKASTSAGVSSNTPTVTGQSAIFTATITNTSTGATPAGSVTFVDQFDNALLGTVNVSGSGNTATATLSTTNLAVASHTVTATFNPSNDFLGSSGSTVHIVSAANTTTTVASSINPSVLEQTVTFTATVLPVAPGAGTVAGFVRFFIDGNAQSPDAPLSGTHASFSTNSLTLGNHTVTAQYLGSQSYNGSIGNLTPDQTVKPNPVAFIVTPGAVVSGKTFTVVVQFRNAAGTGPDTSFNGPISIAINTGPAGGALGGLTTVNAVNGTATFSLTMFRAGSYTLRASAGLLPPVVSSNIEVLASSLIVATSPARIFTGRLFSVNAVAVDVTGQVATNYNGPFVLTVVKKPVLARITGPRVGNFAGGFGTLAGLKVNKAGKYTFRITGPNGLVRTFQINIRARRLS